jgi:hypothetical protein
MARLTQTSIWNATGRVAFNRSEGDLTPAHGPRGAGSGAGRRRHSHSQQGYYVGRRLDATEVHIVSRAELEPLPQLNYQSSEAFNWGCSTAGALDLAFAMLVYTTETRPTDLVCPNVLRSGGGVPGPRRLRGQSRRYRAVADDRLLHAYTPAREQSPDDHAGMGRRAARWIRSWLRRPLAPPISTQLDVAACDLCRGRAGTGSS